jgi:hypothetical protein
LVGIHTIAAQLRLRLEETAAAQQQAGQQQQPDASARSG